MGQVFHSSAFYNSAFEGTSYERIHGNSSGEYSNPSTTTAVYQLMSAAGVLTHFHVKLGSAMPEGGWMILNVIVNGSARLTVNIGEFEDEATDYSSVLVYPGDRVCVRIRGSIQKYIYFTTTFFSDDVNESCLMYRQSVGYTQTLLYRELIPANLIGSIGPFYVHLSGSPGSGNSWTFTVRINDVDTEISVTISDTETSGFHEFPLLTVTPGDVITIRATKGNDATTITAWFGLRLTSSLNRSVFSGFWETSDYTPGTTKDLARYGVINGRRQLRSSGAWMMYSGAQDERIGNLFARLPAAPGTGKKYTVTLVKVVDGIEYDTDVSVEIAGADTEASTDATTLISKGDLVSVKWVRNFENDWTPPYIHGFSSLCLVPPPIPDPLPPRTSVTGLFVRDNEIQTVFNSKAYRSPDFGENWHESSELPNTIYSIGFDVNNYQNSLIGDVWQLHVFDQEVDESYHYTEGDTLSGYALSIDCDLNSNVTVVGTDRALYKTLKYGRDSSTRLWLPEAITDVAIGGSYVSNPFSVFVPEELNDAYLARNNLIYSNAWNDTNSDMAHGDDARIGQSKISMFYHIGRFGIVFDTSLLPDRPILSAMIRLYILELQESTPFSVVVQKSESHPSAPIVVGDYDRTLYSGNGGSVASSTMEEGRYLTIPLNSTGISCITVGGYSRFMIRTNREISGDEPTGSEFVRVNQSEKGGHQSPRLFVTLGESND